MTQSLAERPCEQGFDHQCKWCHVRLSSPTPPKEHEPTPDWEKELKELWLREQNREGGPYLINIESFIRHTIAEAVRERVGPRTVTLGKGEVDISSYNAGYEDGKAAERLHTISVINRLQVGVPTNDSFYKSCDVIKTSL